MQTAMTQAHLQPTATKNARVVSVEPQVKSSKTCKLFNAGALGMIGSAKSADPSCYDVSRSMETGLFETERQMHTFSAGDRVTIFQMSPSKGLLIEGKATIRSRVDDVDEQYVVKFDQDRPTETYERFVDAQGQADPAKYVREFNTKIGKAA